MRADIVRALRPADERARLLAQRGDDPGMDKRMRSSPAGPRQSRLVSSSCRCSAPMSQAIRSSISRMRAVRSGKETGF
jgi:hypothetical protein